MSMSYVWVREGNFPLRRTTDWFATAVGAHASTGFMYREYRGDQEALYVYIDTNTVPGTMYNEATMNQVRNSNDLQNILLETASLFGRNKSYRWSHLQEKYRLKEGEIRVGSHILDCVKASTTPGQFRLYNLCDECENRKTAHKCERTIVFTTVDKKTDNSETEIQRRQVRSRNVAPMPRQFGRYRPIMSFGFMRRPCHRIQTVKHFFQTAALANGFYGFLYRGLDKETGCSKIYVRIIGPEGGWAQVERVDEIFQKTKQELSMDYRPFQWSSLELQQCVEEKEIGKFKTYNACETCINHTPCSTGCTEITYTWEI